MKVLLWGAGAHGRVIHDLAGACGYSDIAFVDDLPYAAGVCVCGSPVLSPDDARIGDYQHFIVSLGDNRLRARCFEVALERGLEPAVLIHPSAVISRSATVGRGTMVLPLVSVGAGAIIGENCILNTACVIEHDSRVSHHAHISMGAILGGEVTVEAHAQVGMGAMVLSRLRVGGGAILGAGAVAVKDVAAGWIVTGLPARPWREIKPS
jgi:sugar O-acyltransferase (sialic acid O-acetyltransferase NeuD family)